MGKRFAVVLISLLTGAGVVFADGGMFFRRAMPKYTDVYQPTQKVYIRWDGSQEKLLIQTKYEGPAEEMVWIVPVPSEPVVERADGSVFNDLSKRTYDRAIDYTSFAVLDTSTGASAGGTSSSAGSPVEWHTRIGDYDVALLRPADGNDVIQWLNANDFAVPEEIEPVLDDYVRDGWWMVASRIHPDALSAITSEKLAKGTLHPLEMTFQSTACVFPMRLTRLAAGPVEELIYIEGPAHYESATLDDGSWDIRLFGGPVREAITNYPLSDVGNTVEILEGRAQVKTSPRLTKLRRVFQPGEMTEDIVFREIDLAQWLASKDATVLTPPPTLTDWRSGVPVTSPLQVANSAPMRIAQAATQYGRWRDPNGIAALVAALSPENLDQVRPEDQDYLPWPSPSAKFLNWGTIGKWSWNVTTEYNPESPGCGHLRSCIWALGEIGIEHATGQPAEDKLLECAQHDNQLIRMEAYIALTKTRSERFGPIVVSRLADVFRSGPLPSQSLYDDMAVQSETDILTDWVVRFGTDAQKDAWIGILQELVASADPNDLYGRLLEHKTPTSYPSWPDWILWRAASSQDQRMLPALEGFLSRLSPEQAQSAAPCLSRAMASYGSTQADASVVHQILDDEARILSEGRIPGTGSFTSLDRVRYDDTYWSSLRAQVLEKRGLAYVLHPMPPEISDRVIRSALSDPMIGDWYALYLLAEIREPEYRDRERLVKIWRSQDQDQRLVAVDVLYVWGDEQTLLDLYREADSTPIRSEVGWAMAALNEPQGLAIIEEQVHESWNPDWLAAKRPFIHPLKDRLGRPEADYLTTEMQRVESALWGYFHPAFDLLDEERLAVLKRIAADPTIHPGMRFDLLGVDYGGTAWGLPLLEQAARDILLIDSSDSTWQRILSTMKAVGNGGFAAASTSE